MEDVRKTADIRFKDLGRYLSKKGASTICPHCKKEDWSLVRNDKTTGPGWPILNLDDSLDDKRIIPIIVLICNNCSYLWPMSRMTIANWLKENPEEDKTEAQTTKNDESRSSKGDIKRED